jgi:dimethylhistidine N-methyltransferase
MNEATCSPIETQTTATNGSSPEATLFLQDVQTGLAKSQKELHCKYFYDERGSQLFDRICELDEYYPTRTELGIMCEHASAIAQRIGPKAVLVEYGSGSSTKTRLLLDHLDEPQAYLPVDISGDHLLQTARQLKADYDDLDIHPIVADFTTGFDLPDPYGSSRTTVYFPGSTIGNLRSDEAVGLLMKIADQCGPEGGLLIGFDLAKDEAVLQAAYDDAAGVTAEFNLNLLHRINRELDADFDVERFAHVATYNRSESRVEIYIESLDEQTVCVGGKEFNFEQGERIFTEYSHKYRVDQFVSMAAQAGLSMDALWTDSNDYFAVMHLSSE